MQIQKRKPKLRILMYLTSRKEDKKPGIFETMLSAACGFDVTGRVRGCESVNNRKPMSIANIPTAAGTSAKHPCIDLARDKACVLDRAVQERQIRTTHFSISVIVQGLEGLTCRAGKRR